MDTARACRTGTVLGVALTIAATACSTATTNVPDPGATKAPSAALAPFYEQRVAWRECGTSFECTKVEVPLDYDKPSGDRIKISVKRLPAHGDRIGSMLINPGGPGGSGVGMVENAAAGFSRKIRQRFDIVGFDPRGVGQSAPVKCLTNKEQAKYLAETEAEELGNAKAAAKEYADLCRKRAGKLLPHVGTENAARDMDVLRAVTGDAKLTYYGVSYGTDLGATYADLFPSKVRALALDSAMDPTLDELDTIVAQTKGLEIALRSFVEDCLRQREECPLSGPTADSAIKEISDLRRQADARPLYNEVDKKNNVTGSWMVGGVRFGLYSKSSWPTLREALTSAIDDRDGTMLRQFTESLLKNPDGTFSNYGDATTAISCATYPYASRKASEAAARTLADETPVFGNRIEQAWLMCHDWPAPEPKKRAPKRATGSDPLLVIGIQRDPATPPEWAESLADQLENAKLVRYEGDGHGAYRNAGSRCIDDIVEDYLINTKLPKGDASCPA